MMVINVDHTIVQIPRRLDLLLQRFLTLKEFSLPLFWFPLVKKIIENLFSISSELVLILDRTQWQNTCLLYTSPSPRDVEESRMPSSA